MFGLKLKIVKFLYGLLSKAEVLMAITIDFKGEIGGR